MGIREINVSEYKKFLGGSQETHRAFAPFVKETIGSIVAPRVEGLRKLDVYNLKGTKEVHNAGSRERAIIFANSTRADGEATEQFINGTKYRMLPATGTGVAIIGINDVPIAEYFEDHNELYILFDVFEEFNEAHRNLFTHIMQQWVEKVWAVYEQRFSWVHASDKQALTKQFTDRLKRVLESELADKKEHARSYERNIEDAKRKIKSYYDNMIKLRNDIERDSENSANVTDKLIKDLDLIVTNPKVSDLKVKDGIFIVSIPNVICHDDKGRHYLVGNYDVHIKLENADVKFFGDTPRKSYWTENDPHPHVDGRNGHACLGNVSSTIAELASRNEIYALVLVCIDFLESANTGDPAGRNVSKWTRCNEDGTPFKREAVVVPEADDEDEDEETWTCEECGNEVTDEEHLVYRHIDNDGDTYESRTVCDSCREAHYTYWESIEEYVHDDYDESDYYNDEGECIR